jgi:hypothetical protein
VGYRHAREYYSATERNEVLTRIHYMTLETLDVEWIKPDPEDPNVYEACRIDKSKEKKIGSWGWGEERNGE